jgi:hypothetical protein
MLFKNSVRTSKRTPQFTITKINWLTLFKFIPNVTVCALCPKYQMAGSYTRSKLRALAKGDPRRVMLCSAECFFPIWCHFAWKSDVVQLWRSSHVTQLSLTGCHLRRCPRSSCLRFVSSQLGLWTGIPSPVEALWHFFPQRGFWWALLPDMCPAVIEVAVLSQVWNGTLKCGDRIYIL